MKKSCILMRNSVDGRCEKDTNSLSFIAGEATDLSRIKG